VRSTEIQTFDRSAVIVPNSNLISGIVKNRVRGDRTGRVILSVSVLRSKDPVQAAEMMVACAKAHPDVLKEPPPRVVFKKIGDPFLEFELVAMVVDVNLGQKVQSDLNFSVFKALADAEFIPPMGPASSFITVQGLEPVRDALGQIAHAVGSSATQVIAPAASGADDARRSSAPEETAPRSPANESQDVNRRRHG
jgi:hypothetical protein